MNDLMQVLQQRIRSMEAELLQQPQVDFPLLHWIEADRYYRAIFIPAGCILTGAVHRLEHECMSLGSILVSTDSGMRHLSGYNRFWAEAGKKRIGLALEDTIWLNIHWTNQKSLEGIEEWLSYPEEHKLIQAVRERRNNQGGLQRCNLPQLMNVN